MVDVDDVEEQQRKQKINALHNCVLRVELEKVIFGSDRANWNE